MPILGVSATEVTRKLKGQDWIQLLDIVATKQATLMSLLKQPHYWIIATPLPVI